MIAVADLARFLGFHEIPLSDRVFLAKQQSCYALADTDC